MKTSNIGIELIKKFEGCRTFAYKATPEEEFYTIGFGHYGADVTPDMKISEAEATRLLTCDVARFEEAVNEVNEKYDYNFDQSEFDALVSFTYNCGVANLKKLTNYGKRTKAEIADKIPAYDKAGGKVLKGLQKRRLEEQDLFLNGASFTTAFKIRCRARRNYYIRKDPKPNGDVIGNTNTNDLFIVTGVVGEWVSTDRGYVHKTAFYDAFE